MSAIIGEGRTCENCKQIIESNFDAHEIFCRRNITLCPKCNEPVQKRAFDEHDREVHKLVKCEKCGIDIDQYFIDQHNTDECTLRIVGLCPYCKIELIPSTLYSHQEECGARTDECQICGARVRNRDMQNHILSNCIDHILEKKTQQPQFSEMNNFNEYSSSFPALGTRRDAQSNRIWQGTSGIRLGEGTQEEESVEDKQLKEERFNEMVEKQKKKIEQMKLQRQEKDVSSLNSGVDYLKQTAEQRKGLLIQSLDDQQNQQDPFFQHYEEDQHQQHYDDPDGGNDDNYNNNNYFWQGRQGQALNAPTQGHIEPIAPIQPQIQPPNVPLQYTREFDKWWQTPSGRALNDPSSQNQDIQTVGLAHNQHHLVIPRENFGNFWQGKQGRALNDPSQQTQIHDQNGVLNNQDHNNEANDDQFWQGRQGQALNTPAWQIQTQPISQIQPGQKVQQRQQTNRIQFAWQNNTWWQTPSGHTLNDNSDQGQASQTAGQPQNLFHLNEEQDQIQPQNKPPTQQTKDSKSNDEGK
ncbi:MAG: hypothetical protein EZS28_011909 [Streblomastix strix]|uniref:TRAFD1/XAF1 zinc finger domain-containing protein n=1 Tax=Streblomastix strix TaxID=222440 RepID=A0A5J4WDP8_9EUKA|nr:MAG: hypothetical protein EZS28_011909 [Streblomastix strix]